MLAKSDVVYRYADWPDLGMEFYKLGQVPRGATSRESLFLRDDMVSRIRAHYKLSPPFDGTQSILWKNYARWGHLAHEALLTSDEKTKEVLSDPLKCGLLHGIHSWANDKGLPEDGLHPEWLLGFTLQLLIRLCEAIGARDIWNPEGGTAQQPEKPGGEVSVFLASLTKKFGSISFPNPFPGEFGLASDRGIITHRALHAIYQAWRLRQLGARSIVEIGAGMGRTAYYAHLHGFNYTLVDLPLVSVAQTCFLTSALGTSKVQLEGETYPQAIRIISPQTFLNENTKYDLALNVDSFPEMNEETARTYGHHIRAKCKQFLSINSESRMFAVRDFLGNAQRHPYWLRKGYVEELWTF